MKRIVFLIIGAAWVATAGAADKFWQQLSAEERVAAGVDHLTAEQRAALDHLADRFATTGARQAVDVAKAEVRREVEHQLKEKETARLGLDDAKRAEEAVSSRLVGTFRGWSGRTVFQFENGQTWIQDGPKENYTVSPQPGPEVEVRRSSFGGWRMTVVSNGRWVWVKRLH